MKTSYYENLININCQIYTPIAISGDKGKLVGFNGLSDRSLSPYCFFRKWKEIEIEIEKKFQNKIITETEYKNLKRTNETDYIEKFYKKVLSPLDAQNVYNRLGKNSVLLCFERPTKFCHRFLVAGWLELNLGITIDELGFENDKQVEKNKQHLKLQIKNLMSKENKKVFLQK